MKKKKGKTKKRRRPKPTFQPSQPSPARFFFFLFPRTAQQTAQLARPRGPSSLPLSAHSLPQTRAVARVRPPLPLDPIRQSLARAFHHSQCPWPSTPSSRSPALSLASRPSMTRPTHQARAQRPSRTARHPRSPRPGPLAATPALFSLDRPLPSGPLVGANPPADDACSPFS